tara:strand:- start:5015 stop:5299 length:285 start_codon:yes stop_codon:yes gene_type:complete
MMSEKTPKQHARERFEHHLADGETWIGIFENKALDSANAGHRVAMFFGMDQWDEADIGDRAPDMSNFIGWKYQLVCKAKTVDEAMANMNWSDDG